jgi:tripartite-type tricarboxylate transporter receptor subunit TctC
MAMPDLREKLIRQEMQPFVSTPEQFGALMHSEIAKFARIVKAANIKPGE